MKKLSLLFLVAMTASLSLVAQVDRSKYPTPGPTPKINIAEPATFTLPNGLKVYVVEDHKIPKITYSLILDRDALLEKDKAGMTEFFGEMMMSGTKQFSKESLDAKIDQLGASIQFTANSASITTLKKNHHLVLPLFQDILLNPTFPEEELKKLKTLAASDIAASKDNAEVLMGKLKNVVLYGLDHAYGETKTLQTIENISRADMLDYYNTYFRPNIGHLAIVGDVSVEEAKKWVTQYFGQWNAGTVPTQKWTPATAPTQTQVSMIHRANSPQALVEVYFPIELPFNDPDALKAQVVGNILGGSASARLFMNLRESKGYTYGSYGGVRPGKLNGMIDADANVGNNVADSAIMEILKEFKKLKDKTITAEELKLAKGTLAGSFARSMESPATLANFAINREIQKLNKDHFSTYLERLEALTLEEVNAYAAKVFRDQALHISVVGNVDVLQPKFAAFGPVTIYDTDGRKVEAAQSADVTATQIFQRYFQALGGEDKLKAVKTSRQKGSAEIQGMTIDMITIIDQANKKSVQSIQMAGQEMTRVFVSPESATVSAMGQQQILEGNEKDDAQHSRYLISELGFLDQGLASEVEGIVNLEGTQVYKVKTTAKSGNLIRTYYDVKSGLRVRMESESTGTTQFSDYKAFGGILFPTKLAIQSPGLPVTLMVEMSNIEIDVPLTDAEIKP
jgi:zinc protease